MPNEDLYKKIIDIAEGLPVYIYGKSLFSLFTKNSYDTLEIFIQDKNVPNYIINNLEKLDEKVSVKYGKDIVFTNEIFTVHCIYADLKALLNGKCNIEGRHLALVDLHKKNIRFIDKENITPKNILDSILLFGETLFGYEIESMKFIIKNKSIVKNINKRDIYFFLRNIFIKSKKPRKTITMLNALGVSEELFGIKLFENNVINDLHKTDINEYFALIFNNVDEEDLELFLIDKIGCHTTEADSIIKLTKIINSIHKEKSNDVFARKILKEYGKSNFNSLCRLLREIGSADLAALIKTQLKKPIEKSELCVDKDKLKATFKVDDMMAEKLLESAQELVIMNPENNNYIQLMSLLYKKHFPKG